MIEVEYNWVVLVVLSAGLASVHLWFPWFDERYAQRSPVWMGLIGGIAAGYAILYLLPKISRYTVRMIGPDPGTELAFLDLQMYLLMLSGLIAYLLMLHLDHSGPRSSALARGFDYGVHGLYSLLVGYVFVEMASEKDGINVMVCAVLTLHMLGMNHVLRAVRTTGFDRAARWIYFLLVLAGTGLGLLTELPERMIQSTTAFLAGIILVFVIAEELPLRYQDRVPWFLVGVALFAAAVFISIQYDPRPPY